MRGTCITLYSTFSVKAGVKKSGKTWSPNTIQLTVHPQTPPNTIPDLLGCLGVVPRVLHTRLHSERAVERYTGATHPTTPLQSSTAYTEGGTFLRRDAGWEFDVVSYCLKVVVVPWKVCAVG